MTIHGIKRSLPSLKARFVEFTTFSKGCINCRKFESKVRFEIETTEVTKEMDNIEAESLRPAAELQETAGFQPVKRAVSSTSEARAGDSRTVLCHGHQNTVSATST